MNLRRQAFIAHIVFGYAGAALVGALTVAVITLLPKVDSLLAHSDQGAVNVVKATGVVANASVDEARQVTALTRDVRAELWHVDRTLTATDGAIGAAQGTLGALSGDATTLNAQMEHVGPLLDSLRASSDAVKPALQAVTATVAAGQPVLTHLDARITDKHVDALLANLDSTSANVASTTKNTAAMTLDGSKVTHHFEQAIDNPPHKPWYIQLAPSIVQEMWRIGEARAAQNASIP